MGMVGRQAGGVADARLVSDFPDVLVNVHDMYNRMSSFDVECDLRTVAWLSDPAAEHARLFAKVTDGLLFDLCYHPERYETWRWLAAAYDTAIDVILNDASKSMAPPEWFADDGARARMLALYRQRCIRSAMRALRLARADKYTDALEFFTLVLYDGLTCEPPMFDFGKQAERRGEKGWGPMLEHCLHFVREAMRCRPTKWNHPYLLGKLLQKQRPQGAPWDAGQGVDRLRGMLDHFFHSAKLAKDQLEPVYRLHATRLKALCSSPPLPLAGLTTLSGFQFDDPAERPREMDAGKLRMLLLQDGISAMRFCLRKRPHFHKARYRLALAHTHEGDVDAALRELSFFFKSSNQFGIKFWEITDKDKKPKTTKSGKRKRGGHGQRAAAPATAPAAPLDPAEASQEVAPKEGVLGALVIRSIGLEESSRKFVSYLRKSLALFLVLLFVERDLAMMETIYPRLLGNDKFKRCTRDLATLSLGAYITALLAALTEPLQPADVANPAVIMLAANTAPVRPPCPPRPPVPAPTTTPPDGPAANPKQAGKEAGKQTGGPAVGPRQAGGRQVATRRGAGTQAEPIVLSQDTPGEDADVDDDLECLGPVRPVTGTSASVSSPPFGPTRAQSPPSSSSPLSSAVRPPPPGAAARATSGSLPPAPPGPLMPSLPRDALLRKSFACYVEHCLVPERSDETATAIAKFREFVASGARGLLTNPLRRRALAIVTLSQQDPDGGRSQQDPGGGILRQDPGGGPSQRAVGRSQAIECPGSGDAAFSEGVIPPSVGGSPSGSLPQHRPPHAAAASSINATAATGKAGDELVRGGGASSKPNPQQVSEGLLHPSPITAAAVNMEVEVDHRPGACLETSPPSAGASSATRAPESSPDIVAGEPSAAGAKAAGAAVGVAAAGGQGIGKAGAATCPALFRHAMAHLEELERGQAVDELAGCLIQLKAKSRQCDMVPHSPLLALWARCTCALASAIKAQLEVESVAVASARISAPGKDQAASAPNVEASGEACAAMAMASEMEDEGPTEMATEDQEHAPATKPSLPPGATGSALGPDAAPPDSRTTQGPARPAETPPRVVKGEAMKSVQVPGAPAAMTADEPAKVDGDVVIIAPPAPVAGVTDDSWAHLAPKERRRQLLKFAFTLFKDASIKGVFKPAAAATAMPDGLTTGTGPAAGSSGATTMRLPVKGDVVTEASLQDLLKQAYELETDKPCRNADMRVIEAYCEERCARKAGARKGS